MKNTNKITFILTDNSMETKIDKPIAFETLIQVFQTATLHALNSMVGQIPADNQAERLKMKEDLYDMYNLAASRTLELFAPEIEMRPHLTTQAILEAENRILEEQFNSAGSERTDVLDSNIVMNDLELLK